MKSQQCARENLARAIAPAVTFLAALLILAADRSVAAEATKDPHAAMAALEQRLADQEVKVTAARALLIRAAEFEPHTGVKAQSAAELAFMKKHPDFFTMINQGRASVLKSSGIDPKSPTDVRSALKNFRQAERSLADLRSQYFALVETNMSALSPAEVGAAVRRGLLLRAPVNPAGGEFGGFTEPNPLDFDDHTGFVQIFDGKSLKDWDGDPGVWHVDNGAIVGKSTWEHPIANSYISYRGTKAKDFDLKLEIKIDDAGGGGIQYRSAVGIPFRHRLEDMPVTDPRWLMTGPQADFWPDLSIFSGQFYSENTPLGIIAWRGQVVNSVPGQKPRLVANIGNRTELGNYVKPHDWNQYEIIARGGTLIHAINGQLMAVEVDDDPKSSNNATGLIGFEIELVPSTLSVRNVWLRKLQ